MNKLRVAYKLTEIDELPPKKIRKKFVDKLSQNRTVCQEFQQHKGGRIGKRVEIVATTVDEVAIVLNWASPATYTPDNTVHNALLRSKSQSTIRLNSLIGRQFSHRQHEDHGEYHIEHNFGEEIGHKQNVYKGRGTIAGVEEKGNEHFCGQRGPNQENKYVTVHKCMNAWGSNVEDDATSRECENVVTQFHYRCCRLAKDDEEDEVVVSTLNSTTCSTQKAFNWNFSFKYRGFLTVY